MTMGLQHFGAIGRQSSAGAVVGLSAVIYSLSYGALLFAGPLASFVGFGISIALISAAIGALFGLFSEERTFVAGPDSNTISVLANIVAVSGAAGLTGVSGANAAIILIVSTTILSALAFYLVARADLSAIVRYIPFPVMAGFLASTGWLMASGAMNIIAGTPLSLAGLHAFMADPFRPQLAFAVLIVASLHGLGRWLSSVMLIPVVMGLATLLVNVVLVSGLCTSALCQREVWLFPGIGTLQWMAPWALDWATIDPGLIVQNLPGMLVVSFVGLLTILLSVASLELNFQKEFDLNQVLRTHALTSAVAGLFGGVLPVISIGRTTVCRQTGGGRISAVIAAMICLAVLLGAGSAIAYIPKAALGALVLYLGLNLMKQWLWDSRSSTSTFELAQIVAILALVANYGFMVGFAAGILISCVAFIVTYSKIPLANLVANAAVLSSSAVRPTGQVDLLRAHGEKVLVYRLSGYVFFGSATKIAGMFSNISTTGDEAIEGIILDFSDVTGIDSSAISVFRRILTRFERTGLFFYFVHALSQEATIKGIAPQEFAGSIAHFPSLDHALEAAEESLIARHELGDAAPALSIFADPADDAIFFSYCETRLLPEGFVLCGEGDPSDSLYFIDHGGLEVIKADEGASPIRLAKLYQGAMVGELAFYTGEVRSASIVVVDDARVISLAKGDYDRMRGEHPDLATRFDHLVILKLSKVLARANKLLTLIR